MPKRSRRKIAGHADESEARNKSSQAATEDCPARNQCDKNTRAQSTIGAVAGVMASTSTRIFTPYCVNTEQATAASTAVKMTPKCASALRRTPMHHEVKASGFA